MIRQNARFLVSPWNAKRKKPGTKIPFEPSEFSTSLISSFNHLEKSALRLDEDKNRRRKKKEKIPVIPPTSLTRKKIQNLFKTRLHNRYHGRCAPRQCTTQMKRDTIDPYARWVAGFPTAVEHRCCRQMNECGRTRDWRSKRCPTFVVPLYPLSLSLFRTLSLTATSSHNINDS